MTCPAKTGCWSRGPCSHVDKATQRKDVAAPRSGVYWRRRRPEAAQTPRERRGLAAPVRHQGAWTSEEEEQDRIPGKTCVFLTSGRPEIESWRDMRVSGIQTEIMLQICGDWNVIRDVLLLRGHDIESSALEVPKYFYVVGSIWGFIVGNWNMCLETKSNPIPLFLTSEVRNSRNLKRENWRTGGFLITHN